MENFVYTGILLGVLVTVHELGHFLAAKAFDVKVLAFSFGFGPALLKFTRGETEYRISAVPLGGYVKLAGDNPDEELGPEEAHRSVMAQAPWKRGLIYFAGPAFSLAFPVLVFFFVNYGAQQVDSNLVKGVDPGLPAASAGIQPGDRILAVDGEPTNTFVEVQAAIEHKHGQDVRLQVARGDRQFEATLVPAKMTSRSLMRSGEFGVAGVSPEAPPPLLGVPADSPAYAAGLRTFDRVLSINGQPISDEAALNTVLRDVQGPLEISALRQTEAKLPGGPAAVPEIVNVKMERQPGNGLAALGAERYDLYLAVILPGSAAEKAGLKAGDRLVAIDGDPIISAQAFRVALDRIDMKPFQLTWRSGGEEKTASVSRQAMESQDELGRTRRAPAFGVGWKVIGIEEVSQREKVTVHVGPAEAMGRSLQLVPKMIAVTAEVVVGLFSGDVPIKNMGGLIEIHRVAGKSAEAGLDQFLEMMALISINLGIINLLPIPILDGFHILVAFWEGIRRRPIDMRTRQLANLVGLVALVALMIVAFYNDLTR